MKLQLEWMPQELYDQLHPDEQRCYDFMHAYTEKLFRDDPLYATMAGAQVYESNRIRPYEHTRAIRLADRDKAVLSKLKRIDPSNFSFDGKLDLACMISDLTYETEQQKIWKRLQDPSTAINLTIDSIYMVALQMGDNFSQKMEIVLNRLEYIPQNLATERRAIKKPVSYWVESAIESTEGAIVFFDQLFQQLAGTRLSGEHRERLTRVRPEIMRELYTYLGWLYRVIDHSHDKFWVGDKVLGKIVKEFLHIDRTPEALARYSLSRIKTIMIQLDRIGEIDGRPWKEILARASSDQGLTRDNISTKYSSLNQQLREFLVEKDILTMHPSDELHIVETPSFFEGQVPSACYIGPGGMEERTSGHFYVTLPTEMRSRSGFSECVGAHFGMPFTCAHEGWPGHHLQALRANEHPRVLRRLYNFSDYTEGWGLHSERMIMDAGFPLETFELVQWLADRLWRWIRVYLDVRMQQGRISPEAGAQKLVDLVGFDPLRAKREISWYISFPGYPMSYAVGEEAIQSMKTSALASGMSSKQFYDKFLSFGSVPLALIKDQFGHKAPVNSGASILV